MLYFYRLTSISAKGRISTMDDRKKTKEQLILELVSLRKRIAELEKAENNRKKVEDELERLATTDKLTQAYNRTKFDEIIKTQLVISQNCFASVRVVISIVLNTLL